MLQALFCGTETIRICSLLPKQHQNRMRNSSTHLQETYVRQWKDFMGKSVSKQEIGEKWIPKYSEEEHPARLMDQMVWLDNIGFLNTDVVWKYYNFAVYGGAKGDA